MKTLKKQLAHAQKKDDKKSRVIRLIISSLILLMIFLSILFSGCSSSKSFFGKKNPSTSVKQIIESLDTLQSNYTYPEHLKKMTSCTYLYKINLFEMTSDSINNILLGGFIMDYININYYSEDLNNGVHVLTVTLVYSNGIQKSWGVLSGDLELFLFGKISLNQLIERMFILIF